MQAEELAGEGEVVELGEEREVLGVRDGYGERSIEEIAVDEGDARRVRVTRKKGIEHRKRRGVRRVGCKGEDRRVIEERDSGPRDLHGRAVIVFDVGRLRLERRAVECGGGRGREGHDDVAAHDESNRHAGRRGRRWNRGRGGSRGSRGRGRGIQ